MLKKVNDCNILPVILLNYLGVLVFEVQHTSINKINIIAPLLDYHLATVDRLVYSNDPES